MKNDIDVTKISTVMEPIEKAAELMEEKDCCSDKDAKRKLAEVRVGQRWGEPELAVFEEHRQLTF